MTRNQFDDTGEADATMERLLRLSGPREGPSPGGRARARAAAHEAWRETTVARSRRRRFLVLGPLLAAAASVILAVVLLRTGDDRHPAPVVEVGRLVRGRVSLGTGGAAPMRPGSEGESLLSGAALRTAEGDVASVALAGGGELRLNGNTAVRLTGARHLGIDSGHIFIDSGHTTGSTLVVETSRGTLHDIGTKFDVRLDGTSLRVRVRQGVVRLDDGARQVDAREGEQLVSKSGQPASVMAADTFGRDWDWLLRAAPFHVEGARLDGFLRWIEVEGARRVEFSPPVLRQRSESIILHGSVDGLTLEESLDVVLRASGLSYRTAGDRIVIARAEAAK